MDSTRFDSIAKLFAARLSRRPTMIQAGASLAAGLLDPDPVGQNAFEAE